ncbi:uncharacterized protein LOC114270433 [Camellia sinensis]|uniref:uncharacterized protein LOC114270433 n=1 Tax=Camellia sinensis TaxID=4442 RepID=UPI00103631C9|nr:uncharacterized protein LOC114270433 [Camellia sinensis]
MAKIFVKEWDMVKTLNEFRIQVESQDTKVYLGAQKVMPKLISEIMEAQKHDQEEAYIKGRLESGEPMLDWVIHPNGSLRYQGSTLGKSFDYIEFWYLLCQIVIHDSPPDFRKVYKKLWKYIANPSHVINREEISLNKDVIFEEGPVAIQDSREKNLRGKTVHLVKVLWRHRGIEESTWEREEAMRTNYPQLF